MLFYQARARAMCAPFPSVRISVSDFLGDEDQLIRLGFFGRLGFPVRVAFDFFESCGLEIMEDFPVGEESYAFVVSEYVCAVGGFYDACLFPPGYAVYSVIVFHAVDVSTSYASGTGLLNMICLHLSLCLF